MEKKYYHQSEALVWTMCEIKHRMEFIEKRKAAPNSRMSLGSAVDDAITFSVHQKIGTGEYPTFEVALTEFDKTFEKRKNECDWDDEDPKESYEVGKKILKLWFDEVAPKIHPKSAQLYLKADIPGKDYGIGGTLDIVEEDGMIRDTKVSLNAKKEHELANSVQAASYTLLYRLNYGKDPAGFAFDALRKLKTPKYEATSGKIEQPGIDRYLRVLDLMHEAIRSGREPKPASELAWWCTPTECPFWNQCKGALAKKEEEVA